MSGEERKTALRRVVRKVALATLLPSSHPRSDEVRRAAIEAGALAARAGASIEEVLGATGQGGKKAIRKLTKQYF